MSDAPYRGQEHVHLERLRAAEAELRVVDSEIARMKATVARRKAIASEVADLRRKAAAKRALPLLSNVRVAAPCDAPWEDMVGDHHVRFCGQCEKHVYNVSMMTSEEAEAFLRERLGKDTCIRLYRRLDGTLITADCPVGAKKRRIRRVALSVLGAGLMGAGALAGFDAYRESAARDALEEERLARRTEEARRAADLVREERREADRILGEELEELRKDGRLRVTAGAMVAPRRMHAHPKPTKRAHIGKKTSPACVCVKGDPLCSCL